MASVKDIIVKPINATMANNFVKAHHYSGKVVPNSQLHFGCFLNGVLGGVMQFGPSMDKRKVCGLVKNTPFNDFLELNRMAFNELLPKNSESRCISVAIRLIKKYYPNIKWIISFADGCQCGDGTIYRASGFKLTDIRENHNLCRLPSGETVHKMTLESNPTQKRKELSGLSYSELNNGKNDFMNYVKHVGGEIITGYQLRYIYFIDKSYEKFLTVPVLSFNMIDKMNARMYKGKAYKKDNACLVQDKNACVPVSDGGESPTDTHQVPQTNNNNAIQI